ncbi:hypothetical protein VDG1235_1740 [Verrucomicrobiia bacterium DG1235]|nr:hypothetical protein VDG1235_1740 [Verrucomicrobiae bacterium DG1235]
MTPTIAALSQQPTVSENVSFIIVGFLFVLVVLGALSLVTFLIGTVFKRLMAQHELHAKPTALAPAPVAPPASPKVEDGIPEHIVALIATATHIALKGRPQKIVSIRGASQHWAQEGRRQIFSSHRVR